MEARRYVEQEWRLVVAWEERIELNPEVLVGKPVIKGTRISGATPCLRRFASSLTITSHGASSLLSGQPRTTCSGRDQHRWVSDEQVLVLGLHESRILITDDKDFGDFVVVRRRPAPHGVILLRASDERSETFARIVVKAFARETEWGGFFSVLEDGGVRRTEIPQN